MTSSFCDSRSTISAFSFPLYFIDQIDSKATFFCFRLKILFPDNFFYNKEFCWHRVLQLSNSYQVSQILKFFQKIFDSTKNFDCFSAELRFFSWCLNLAFWSGCLVGLWWQWWAKLARNWEVLGSILATSADSYSWSSVVRMQSCSSSADERAWVVMDTDHFKYDGGMSMFLYVMMIA